MTLKVMADNRVEISAKQDGAVYNVALGDKDFIIQGLGDEFAMSYTGLVVSVESGEAVVHGRHITADETEQITLPQNQSGYLVLRIDLTQVSGAEAMLYATPTLTNEEINWSGNIYDMPIATFTTSNTSVTNFEDVRKIKGSLYPTKVSELENDLDFALKNYVDAQDTALNNALTYKQDKEWTLVTSILTYVMDTWHTVNISDIKNYNEIIISWRHYANVLQTVYEPISVTGGVLSHKDESNTIILNGKTGANQNVKTTLYFPTSSSLSYYAEGNSNLRLVIFAR